MTTRKCMCMACIHWLKYDLPINSLAVWLVEMWSLIQLWSIESRVSEYLWVMTYDRVMINEICFCQLIMRLSAIYIWFERVWYESPTQVNSIFGLWSGAFTRFIECRRDPAFLRDSRGKFVKEASPFTCNYLIGRWNEFHKYDGNSPFIPINISLVFLFNEKF